MADRRRINGPTSGTSPAVFGSRSNILNTLRRQRKPNELRRIFLKTGLVPAASGSAYYELESTPNSSTTFIPITSTIKLSCSVHGPRPLPRNASFSPNLQLSASIKFAPFASRHRRSYIRDNVERDLGSHLENALRGVIIPDRWPKSAIDIAVIVLEGEEDGLGAQEHGRECGISGVGLMNVLAGSITVATAALIDAGIDCLDLLTGGVAAFAKSEDGGSVELLDPCPSEHTALDSACVVAYLPSRDELTEIWSKGQVTGISGGPDTFGGLVDAAIRSARGAHGILTEVLTEAVTAKLSLENTKHIKSLTENNTDDIEMNT